MSSLPFADRLDAAHHLAAALAHLRGRHPLVLGIPRGAVPMAREIARRLDADFDVLMVRKLGAPGQPELAVGAVDESGHAWIAEHAAACGADADWLREAIARERRTMATRRARWGLPDAPLDARGRTVVVVDDGIATGATLIVALDAVRRRQPAHLVCAVPVGAPDSVARVRAHCDEIVCLHQPMPFPAVGAFYERFDPVNDDEVQRCLHPSVDPLAAPRLRGVDIDLGDTRLAGDLAVPAGARALVVFAHGSGSSRHSPRNRAVAAALNARGLATLLLDLLTTDEDDHAARRFDIGLLSRRLLGAIDWTQADPALRGLPLGLFGASTGAASALEAAARRPALVGAVVSRGGRPDLASPAALTRVRAPCLLLVGSEDREVLALNRAAQAAIGAGCRLLVVPGASHLFEEAGALDAVARAAGDWFARWLLPAPTAGRRA